jgi:hypothetical protein
MYYYDVSGLSWLERDLIWRNEQNDENGGQNFQMAGCCCPFTNPLAFAEGRNLLTN